MQHERTADSDSKGDAPALKAMRLLVLDDDRSIRLMIEKILPKFGYEVDAFSEGEAVVEAYREALQASAPYDLVILDLTIPGGMGGDQVIIKLREMDPQVKAIATSGFINDPVIVDPASFGFLKSLTKPFDLIVLRDIIRDLSGEGV